MHKALQISTVVCAVLVLGTLRPAAQSASLQRDALDDWTSLTSTMMKISEAMPADKYGYKSTAPQRNFGEQILHVAEANVIQMGRLGFKGKAPAINMKVTSKTEILEALSESFDYGTAALKEQND